VLFTVRSGTAVRVYRTAVDAEKRVWYLVHVNSRPGWIAGWLTRAAPVRAASTWHSAMASSFGVGDGLIGNGMACGSKLTASVMAVANRSLACGTSVRIKIGSSVVVAKVMDRGPWVSGRTFDLAPAVCHALNSCRGVFRIEWQVAH
jgi:rare lipoprotein A (peptidoglycan hydrolase)